MTISPLGSKMAMPCWCCKKHKVAYELLQISMTWVVFNPAPKQNQEANKVRLVNITVIWIYVLFQNALVYA